jgi:ABC-2 type transport system ATP-binding protein
MIEIQRASRRYGTKIAVDDVSLTINRGEIVGLLGHNGAGKTTLMKMLTGFLEPSTGTISVGGVDVVKDRTGVQRQIGYLPENAPIYAEMLVQEYLLMMAELRAVPADLRVAAAGRAAVATGLQQHLTAPIRTLSKGFRQRVGIAQAILHDPDVLVLDEPTNGLDPVQIQSIRDLIHRLAHDTTIILSTHILQEVEAVCDRVVILIDGHLATDAPLSELLASHRIRLSLADSAEGVQRVLRDVDGVAEVSSLGPDETLGAHTVWALTCTGDTLPTSRVLRAALNAGWSVGAVSPEVQTLDGVFRRLQREHIARVEAA